MARTTALTRIEQALYEPTFYKVIQGGMSCFVAGTEVLMADGSYAPIEELKSGDKILSRGADGGIIKTEVKSQWYAGDGKPIISVKINGEEIRATYDHKFYTTKGYVELYKIVWGKMEASQRVQLELLCEQYGQDIHMDSVWCKEETGDNETCNVGRQEEKRPKRLYEDDNRQETYSSPQSSSRNLDTKSREQAVYKPYKWRQGRQQSRELGVVHNERKSTSRIQDWADKEEIRQGHGQCEVDGRASDGNSDSMEHWSGETEPETICGKVWRLGVCDKGRVGEQVLEVATIDEIQIQQREKVFAIETNHETHNYFVSRANVNVSNSGKTFGIMTLLIAYADSFPKSLITVVGMSYPHLKAGTIRDFKKIMEEAHYWNEERWSKGELIYTFPSGSMIEFKSVDRMTARGPRRDVLFVNEANGIQFETFSQLADRTKVMTIIDYNPSAKFWAHEELVEKLPNDTSFIVLTYKDNEALSQREVENIEKYKPKPGEEPSNWWTVYGLGQIGSLEGNVYSGWEEQDEEYITTNGRLVRYGLDFGFSNDETAMVAIYELEGDKTGVVEKIYKKGILGSQYGEILMSHNIDPSVLIVADSARPEIIAEIKKCGFRCVGADKNAGSVKRGIDRVCQRQIVYSGQNLKREYLSYAWRKKRTGEVLDEPEDGNDHCLPYSTKVDTTRGQKPIGQLVGTKGWLYAEDGKIRYYRNVRQTGVEPILKITLSDGRVIRCSSEHPIYTLNRGIIPASLLNEQDAIQCVIYGTTTRQDNHTNKARVQRHQLLERQEGEILPKRPTQTTRTPQSRLGILQRLSSSRNGHRPHRQESRQQPNRELKSRDSIGEQQKCFRGNDSKTTRTNGKSIGKGERMAQVRSGKSRSLRDWQEIVARERAARKNLRPLWERLLYTRCWDAISLLLWKLQNARKNKTIKGASGISGASKPSQKVRHMWKNVLLSEVQGDDVFGEMPGQEDIHPAKIEADGVEPVYCLDVYDTSNFSIEGGVIVSNCMDSLRYAIDELSRPKFDF